MLRVGVRDQVVALQQERALLDTPPADPTARADRTTSEAELSLGVFPESNRPGFFRSPAPARLRVTGARLDAASRMRTITSRIRGPVLHSLARRKEVVPISSSFHRTPEVVGR